LQLVEAIHAGDFILSIRCMLRVVGLVEEEMRLSMKRLGKPVTEAVVIADFQGVEYLKHLNNLTAIQGGIESCKIFEQYCPESIKSVTCINTMSLFKIGFDIVKPFLSNKSLKKLEVFGCDKNKWMPVLRRRIPQELLPPRYGGTRAGKDEICSDAPIWNDGVPLPPNSLNVLTGKAKRYSLWDNEMDISNLHGKLSESDRSHKDKIEFISH